MELGFKFSYYQWCAFAST